jgi:hypothetical protein
MLPVSVEMHLPVSRPAQLQHRQWLAFERKNHGEVPIQDIYVEVLPLGDQSIQKMSEFCWHRALPVVRHEAGPTIDIPTNDENRFLGLLSSGCKRSKIRRTIDQEGDPLGAGDAPTIPSFG